MIPVLMLTEPAGTQAGKAPQGPSPGPRQGRLTSDGLSVLSACDQADRVPLAPVQEYRQITFHMDGFRQTTLKIEQNGVERTPTW